MNDLELAVADRKGVFPEGFYATTNYDTDIFLDGSWVPVAALEMDVGIRVRLTEGARIAEGCPMHHVRPGDTFVVGREGVRVRLPAPDEAAPEGFRFMSGSVSNERPKAKLVAEVASAIRGAHERGQRVALVGGPAIVHSASAPLLEKLIHAGEIDLLLAGNALATHDLEAALYGTSLGVDLETGSPRPHGHEHHLRTINRIRREGSISEAVRTGVITRGIMHACVTKPIPFVLAGSIRDDGPLPDVITDVTVAVDAMRDHLRDVGVVIVVATTLHGVAVGNLLPAKVSMFCVDAHTDTVIKLTDRGSHQAVGIVTDCEYFLSELVRALEGRPSGTA